MEESEENSQTLENARISGGGEGGEGGKAETNFLVRSLGFPGSNILYIPGYGY